MKSKQSKGKATYQVDHSKMGTFKGKLMSGFTVGREDFIEVLITEGIAKSETGYDDRHPGQCVIIMRSLATFTKIPQA